MKKLLILLVLATACTRCCSQPPVHYIIKTALGNIHVELYPAKAPITVANFLRYADKRLYDSTTFFRVCTPVNEATRKVKIEVIQGGDVPENKQFDSIKLETTLQTGLLHKNGTLSMARGGPNSATCSFFICIGPQPSLDYGGARNPDGQGFAAFGQVTSGMHVVKAIQAQKDTAQYLIKPVRIWEVRRG